MAEDVSAFSTAREGGVGTGAYAGFNITHYCGDSELNVQHNRKLLCKHLGIADDALILPRQTHGTAVLCIDEQFLSLSAGERVGCLHAVDSVVTDVAQVCIGVSTADCVPVLLYDAVKRVVAAVHAGWRGTVGRIAERTLAAMKERYGTDACNVKAVIGPSISLEAFEVGDEVYDVFAAVAFPMELIARKVGEKWHIDLWEANRLQLLACGVKPSAIEVCGICTYNNVENFFSARRLGVESGRIFNGIILKK